MTKLRFLVSLITQDNDYQMEQAAAAKAAAAELGVEAQILYADNDPSPKHPGTQSDPDGTLASAQRHPHRTSRCHFFPASGRCRR